ncbi:hypothetical protein [Leisingera daeponensis]|uniref:hypothetical protein n=1 Tax=Leisingera daeponensis TaxID=405746 RepID=UPI0021BD5E3D|nr:hypothetical protein [Leisingera daeponensis]
MVKAVFIQSSHSDYDDQPGKAYHFPKKHYLSRVEQTVGDWVIFYEGRRGGGKGYHSVQRVLQVQDDPKDPALAYALLDTASELSFENFVPRWVEGQGPYETGLPRSRGSNTSAVRLISDADFRAYCQRRSGGARRAECHSANRRLHRRARFCRGADRL